MPFTYNTVGVSGYSGAQSTSFAATYANSFTPGQAIYRSTGGYALAQANAISSCDVIGIVQSANSTSFTAVTNGNITGLTGLTDATEYYLSDQTAGLLTTVPPSANGSIIKPLMISTGTSTGVVLEYPGVQIGATNYGTSGYVAKWTTNQSIGNSIVQDNGIGITINGGSSAIGNLTGGNFPVPGVYSGIEGGYGCVEVVGTSALGALVDFSIPNIDNIARIIAFAPSNSMTLGIAAATGGVAIVSSGNVGIGNLGGFGAFSVPSPNAVPSTLTVAGTISAQGWVNEMTVTEYTTVSAAAPGSTIQFDTLTQSVLLYTSNVVNNWTLNVRGNSTTPLSSILNVGQTITLTLMTSAAGSGFYQTGMTIDGATATAKWQGGTAPSSGDTSAMDIYSYSITRVSATPSYVVLASVAKFA